MGSELKDQVREVRLVRQALQGDEDAFRQLLEEHRQAITSTLVACGVRCSETAADLAQDCALRAWQQLSSLRNPRAFSPWIRRIAANAARDHLRRVAIRREDEMSAARDIADGSSPYLDAERRAELEMMLQALGTEQPESVDLLLASANGVSSHELARRLDISEAAFKMRLVRLRKRLRAQLEKLRRGESSKSLKL